MQFSDHVWDVGYKKNVSTQATLTNLYIGINKRSEIQKFIVITQMKAIIYLIQINWMRKYSMTLSWGRERNLHLSEKLRVMRDPDSALFFYDFGKEKIKTEMLHCSCSRKIFDQCCWSGLNRFSMRTHITGSHEVKKN